MQRCCDILKSIKSISNINNLKEKKTIIIIDSEKAFGKIPYTLLRLSVNLCCKGYSLI